MAHTIHCSQSTTVVKRNHYCWHAHVDRALEIRPLFIEQSVTRSLRHQSHLGNLTRGIRFEVCDANSIRLFDTHVKTTTNSIIIRVNRTRSGCATILRRSEPTKDSYAKAISELTSDCRPYFVFFGFRLSGQRAIWLIGRLLSRHFTWKVKTVNRAGGPTCKYNDLYWASAH